MLSPDERHLDLARFRRLGGADLGVAVLAPLPDGADRASDIRVARFRAHERFQVVALLGEEAGEELPSGREAGAGAGRAEGLGDRRADADYAGAVGVAPALRDFAAIVRVHGNEGKLGG